MDIIKGNQKSEWASVARPLNILVVDDEEALQKFLRLAITKIGQVAEVAGGCQEARQMVDEADFDLAFVDINLPDGDGVDLIADLQRSSPGILIVAMSGDSCRVLESRARSQKIIFFLIKPFALNVIHSIIGHILKIKAKS